MILSDDTLELLKSFSTINQSLLFKSGNVLATVSPSKTIVAKATVNDTFPVEFAVYNLPEFLNDIGNFDHSPELTFEDNRVVMTDGEFSSSYPFDNAELIISPPKTDLELPSVDAEFKLSKSALLKVLRGASILARPEVAFICDGENISFSAIDVRNDMPKNFEHKVGQNTKNFKFVFRLENMQLMPRDYDVTISHSGHIAHFKSDIVEYYVVVESTSTYDE